MPRRRHGPKFHLGSKTMSKASDIYNATNAEYSQSFTTILITLFTIANNVSDVCSDVNEEYVQIHDQLMR